MLKKQKKKCSKKIVELLQHSWNVNCVFDARLLEALHSALKAANKNKLSKPVCSNPEWYVYSPPSTQVALPVQPGQATQLIKARKEEATKPQFETRYYYSQNNGKQDGYGGYTGQYIHSQAGQVAHQAPPLSSSSNGISDWGNNLNNEYYHCNNGSSIHNYYPNGMSHHGSNVQGWGNNNGLPTHVSHNMNRALFGWEIACDSFGIDRRLYYNNINLLFYEIDQFILNPYQWNGGIQINTAAFGSTTDTRLARHVYRVKDSIVNEFSSMKGKYFNFGEDVTRQFQLLLNLLKDDGMLVF